MALRRMALTASALALCLAFPALSDTTIAFPDPPEPAEVSLTAADLGLADAILADLPLPEPAPVVLDIAVAAPEDTAPEPASPGETRQAAGPSPMATQPDEADPATVTAALPPAAPPSALEISALPPAADDILAALPPAPEPAPLDLAGAAPAPPAHAIAPSVIAAPASAPAVDLSPYVAERMRAAVRSSRLPDREEQAVAQVYAERGHQPIWIDGTGFTAAARAVQALLATAGQDGLRPQDYLVTPRAADPQSLADADVALSVAAVLYARDARGGRIDPRRLSALITPKLELPSSGELLPRLAASPAPAELLAALQPRHEGYRALKAKLAELRAGRPDILPTVRIPSGPAIRLGMRDERVTLLRARFGLGGSGAGPGEERTYDRALATQVAEFQRGHGLSATGVLTRQTQDLLNGDGGGGLEGDLIAAMERWRWLPSELGEDHIIVNVPEYTVRKVEDGRIVHEARVVVGRPERPTPVFSDMMDHIVVNPSWTIPPTILRKDILPKLAADPGYAERRGFEVIRRGDRVTVRQPPGPSNALGVVKLMFPNDHAVYLHDTPSRGDFARGRRALSSGCVRVERPLKLAELALGGTKTGWSEQRLRGMVGFGERTIRLERKLPIHLVYMTHVVEADGSLRQFEDIYGFHRRTRDALGL